MAASKFTKADMVDAVFGRTGMDRGEIRAVLDVFLLEIKSALLRGSAVEFRGFGSFEVRTSKGRSTARNPRTGETVVVPPRGTVAFRAGADLKAQVRDCAQGRTPE